MSIVDAYWVTALLEGTHDKLETTVGDRNLSGLGNRARTGKSNVRDHPRHQRPHTWHHRGWGWGPWAWLGLGAGVVAGAIIADEAYRPHPGHYYDEGPYDGPYYYPANYRGDPREICQQNFRTFEWRTGLYTTPSGEKRLCPYLRDAGPPPEGSPPPPRAPY